MLLKVGYERVFPFLVRFSSSVLSFALATILTSSRKLTFRLLLIRKMAHDLAARLVTAGITLEMKAGRVSLSLDRPDLAALVSKITSVVAEGKKGERKPDSSNKKRMTEGKESKTEPELINEEKEAKLPSLDPATCDRTLTRTLSSPPADRLTLAEITSRRAALREPASFFTPYPELSVKLVRTLLTRLDTSFFGGRILPSLLERGHRLSIKISRRLFQRVSFFRLEGNDLIYTICQPLLLLIIPEESKRVYLNAALPLADRLDALIQILEHDLVHLWEFLETAELPTEAHSDFFRRHTANYFGHVRCLHLPITK